MKIAILTQEYHTGEQRFGGAGRAIGKIANWLADSGHDVTVYMQSKQSGETEERPGLQVVLVAPKPRIHWRLRPLVGRLPASIRGWIWHYEVNCALSERILKDYRSGKIEVLLTNRGVTAPSLMIHRRLPTVVRAQLALPPVMRLERLPVAMLDRYLHWRECRALRCATRVYAPSRLIAGLRRRDARRDIEVIRTPMFALWQPNEWEEVKTRYRLPEHYLLYWGGLLYCKGIDVVVNALPRVMEENPDLSFVFVGDRETKREDGDSLGDRLRECGASIGDRVRFLPSMEQPDLFSIIEHAHAVVLPSVIDNLPNTLLEAMYFGKVIVASKGASLDELLEDGISGILFPKGCPESLAAAILRARDLGAEQRSAMGAAAKRALVANCSPERVMDQVLRICREAVEEHHRNVHP